MQDYLREKGYYDDKGTKRRGSADDKSSGINTVEEGLDISASTPTNT